MKAIFRPNATILTKALRAAVRMREEGVFESITDHDQVLEK